MSWTEKKARTTCGAGWHTKGSTGIDGQDEGLTHKLYAASRATTNPCPCLNFPEKKQRPGYKYAAAPSSADSSPNSSTPPVSQRASRALRSFCNLLNLCREEGTRFQRLLRASGKRGTLLPLQLPPTPRTVICRPLRRSSRVHGGRPKKQPSISTAMMPATIPTTIPTMTTW